MLANISQFESIVNSANSGGNAFGVVHANNAQYWDNREFLNWLLLGYQVTVPTDPRAWQSAEEMIDDLQRDK